jgi:cytochrome c-type biogenesis protein
MNFDQLNLAFAFSAGMLATVNPCAWAMLPAFVSYYLGTEEEGYVLEPLSERALEGIKLGLLITAGFLLIFGGMALVISAGLRFIIKVMPVLAIIVGGLLALLGIWLLAGKSLPIRIPQPQIDVSARNNKSVFMYGLAYGFASLSCTLPIFLAVVGASLTISGMGGLTIMFAAYGAGMATVLMSVAIGTAMFKGIVLQWFRKILPYVHTIGAVMLIVAGIYLIWFQAQYLPYILAGFS